LNTLGIVAKEQQSSIEYPESRIEDLASSPRLTAIHPAAGGGILAFDPGLNYVGGAADARADLDCPTRTVQGTRPALHAAVSIKDCGLWAFHLKNSVGTDTFTHATADARPGIKLQGGHIR